jgi:hypothetical protein
VPRAIARPVVRLSKAESMSSSSRAGSASLGGDRAPSCGGLFHLVDDLDSPDRGQAIHLRYPQTGQMLALGSPSVSLVVLSAPAA